MQEGPASNATAEVVVAYKHLCMSHTLSEVDCATRCVGCRELVSVPEPRGTAVGEQNKRDHVAAACSTELSTTGNFHVVHAAATLIYIPDRQDKGHGPIRVTADVKAASDEHSLVVRFSYIPRLSF